MKFADVMIALQREPVFDLPLLEVVSGQNRNTLRVQLHRWIADGKVIALRRGLYTLAEGLSAPKQGAVLANLMVSPSYLTGLWTLSWYGLIPEAVYEYTSAVVSYKQQYENTFGRFSYRRLKPDFFRGWQTVDYANSKLRVATPEKAVLDHIYWTPGDAVQTMKVLRFQPDGVPGFSWEALMQCAEKWGSQKLVRFAAAAPNEFSSDWEEI
jgi:hypothetical protein